jgi:NADH:ubiquinone oxidoreductase subunit 4 (subunit M)
VIPRHAVAALVPRGAGAAVAVVTLAVAIAVAVEFKTGDGGYQMVSDHTWAKELGIHWSVGVDGISLFLLLMTALLFPLSMLGARARRDPAVVRGLAAPAGGRLPGSFVSLDLVLFFLFFELTLVPGLLPHRRMGVRPDGATRPSSSSSTPSPARPSCWWGSWPWPSSTSHRPGS